MLDVCASVDDWLHEVDEEEDGDHGEDESHVVPGQPDVDHSIPLEGAECLIVPVAAWLDREGDVLLPQTLDVHVDLNLQLGLSLEVLDHFDY